MTSAATTSTLERRQVAYEPVAPWMVAAYRNMFVNRRAYLRQRHTPLPNGKFSYYSPKDTVTGEKLPLTDRDIAAHLAGRVTLSFYCIRPVFSTCKWIALDADYPGGIADLRKLQEGLALDGVVSLFEASRRGGHLWIFGSEPLPASSCRILVYNLAFRLGVPIKGSLSDKDGIEVFPLQDAIEDDEFGNAVRGPLGIHRATMQRYWFEDAPHNLADQLTLLSQVQRLSLIQLETLTAGMSPVSTFLPAPPPPPPRADYSSTLDRIFRIRDHVGHLRKADRKNYKAQCPSCKLAGNDRGRDNLVINIANDTMYHCWAGCTTDDIRAACGFPPARRK